MAADNGAAGTLLLDPDTLTLVDAFAADVDGDFDSGGTILSGDPNGASNEVSWDAIATFAESNPGADIVLEATGDVQIGDLDGVVFLRTAMIDLDTGGSLVFRSVNGSIRFDGVLDGIAVLGGSVTFDAGDDLRLGQIRATGGITLDAGSELFVLRASSGSEIAMTANNDIRFREITGPGVSDSGDVIIQSRTGSVTGRDIIRRALSSGDAGDVIIGAATDVTIDELIRTLSFTANGGSVTIE